MRFKAKLPAESAHILCLARTLAPKGIVESYDDMSRMQRLYKRPNKLLWRLRGVCPIKRAENRNVNAQLSNRAHFL